MIARVALFARQYVVRTVFIAVFRRGQPLVGLTWGGGLLSGLPACDSYAAVFRPDVVSC